MMIGCRMRQVCDRIVPAIEAAAILCSLSASPLNAMRHAAEEPNEFRITGVVVSERNGAAVPNCHLTATRSPAGVAAPRSQKQRRNQASDDGPSTDTDLGGHFSLAVPSAGSWQIYGYGRGFRQQAYDRHENFFSAVVLTPAAPTYDMVFRMEPDSAISGLVLDEAGEGVRNARLTLRAAEPLNPDLADGLGSVRAGTATDDRGHYEFAGLAPGDYIVGVQAEPWYAAAMQAVRFPRGNSTPPDPSLDVVYPQTWFPGVSDRQAAEVISLHHGEDRQADFNLTPLPATHLHISAPSPPAAGKQRGQVFPSVERVDGDGTPFVNTSIQFDQQGQMDVSGLSPGLYRVMLQGSDSPQSPAFIRDPGGAQHSLDLSAAIPVSNLTIRLEAEGDFDRVQIVFTDLDTGATFTSYGAANIGRSGGSLQRRSQPQNAAGALGGDRTLEVPPGRYRVTLIADGDIYLSAMSIKNQPVQGRIAVLASGSTTLNLKLTHGRASVRGISSLAGKPLPGAMVLLVPATFGQPGSITMLRRDQTNTDGGFVIENVIPGDYILLAIDHGWTVNWRDPSTLQRFLTHGLPLSLQPSATVRQELTAQIP